MKKSTCQNCGADFIGRSNQRYCTTSCKAEFNNGKASLKRLATRETDEHLKRNHQILHELTADCGKLVLTKERLLATGYELGYMTHLAKDESGKVGRGLYEFVIIDGGDKLTLIKQ